jgi:hypothetical protein
VESWWKFFSGRWRPPFGEEDCGLVVVKGEAYVLREGKK